MTEVDIQEPSDRRKRRGAAICRRRDAYDLYIEQASVNGADRHLGFASIYPCEAL